MKRNLFSMMLAAAMTLSLTACSTSNDTSSTTDTSTANNASSDPFRILSSVSFGKDEEEQQKFEEALSAVIGLPVKIDKPASDYDTVLLQKLKSGDKYDLVYGDLKTASILMEQGAVTDLTAKIEASSTLSDTQNIPASEWDQIRLDGKLYASFNKKEVQKLAMVNAALAKQAGIDVATIDPTLDGYYKVLKTMKEKITTPGFYPLNIAISKWHDLQPYFAATGTEVTPVTVNGKIVAPITDPAAAPVWEWLVKLYQEGLLDPDSLTDGTKEMRDKFQTGYTGMISDWAAWVGLYNKNAGAEYPANMEAVGIGGLKTPEGNFLLDRGGPSLWMIPINASYPEQAFQLLEYFATVEGGMLLSLGIEGHDYEIKNGKYIHTETGEQHSNDHGAPLPISEKFVNPMGLNPGFEEALSFVQYAVPEELHPKMLQYKEEIAQKYGVQIITGQMSVSDGMAKMKEELMSSGVIDE